MFKEIQGIEAFNAALEGKQVLQIYNYIDDDLMLEDLTAKIIEILKRKNARYLIDVSEDRTKKEPEPVRKKEAEKLPESIEYALKEEEAQHLSGPCVTPVPSPKEPEQEQRPSRAVQEESKTDQKTSRSERVSAIEKRRGKYRTGVDVGKIMALHKAGWTNIKIGEELQLTPQTIARYIKTEEAKENGTT